jgi:hypothetical protein
MRTYTGGACPTCSDGVQNQAETGVDCGGTCTACTASNTCTCNNGGTAATGALCWSNNANICTACSGEFFLDGSACTPWAAPCAAGEAETQAPSTAQNRECTHY